MKNAIGWLLLLGVVGSAFVGCVTRQEACAPGCATGCCDARGVCKGGSEHAACGNSGSACENCGLQHGACQNQTCIGSPDGGGAGGGGGAQEACAAGCATGCCDALGVCKSGIEHAACGTGARTCENCSIRHSVCQGQVCILSPDGGGAGGGTGGGGGAAPDAGTYPDGGSRARYWDGGSCSVATNCPCFSSDDCGPGFYCHSQDSSGANVFCIPGSRGAGAVGDGCSGETSCQSALCTDSASSGMRCSALCDVAAECPATLPRCIYIGFGVDRSICSP